MSVRNEVPAISYFSSANQTEFAIPFDYEDRSGEEIRVIRGSGDDAVVVPTTEYSIVALPEDQEVKTSYIIRFLVGEPEDTVITIERCTDIDQQVQYVEGGLLSEREEISSFDKLTRIAQELKLKGGSGSISTGGGGGDGLNQAAVDARVDSLVEAWALLSNPNEEIPVEKLKSLPANSIVPRPNKRPFLLYPLNKDANLNLFNQTGLFSRYFESWTGTNNPFNNGRVRLWVVGYDGDTTEGGGVSHVLESYVDRTKIYTRSQFTAINQPRPTTITAPWVEVDISGGVLDYSAAEADISKSLKFLVEQRDIDFSVGQKTIDWEDDTIIAGGNVVLMQGIDGDIVNAGYSETPPETNYLLKYKGRDIPFKLALFTSNDHISLFTSVSDPELPANLSITFNGNTHTRDSHTNTDEVRRYRFVPQTAITVGDDFTLNITGTNVEFGTLEHTNPVNRTIIDEELIKKVKSKIVVVSNDDGSIRPATADDYHNRALAIIGQNIRIATKIPVSTVNITYEDNFDPWADDAGVTYRGVYNNYYDRNNAAARDGVYSKNQHGFYVYTAADGWTFPRPQPANVRGNYANEAEANNHISANGQVAEWGNELHRVTAYTAGVEDGYIWGQLQDIQTLIDSLQAVETGLEGVQTSVSNLTTEVEGKLDKRLADTADDLTDAEKAAFAAKAIPTVTPVDDPDATEVSVNTTDFGNNLSGSDNTVQKALNTLDDLDVSSEDGGNFDIDALSTDVLADNSEFGFNKKTPIREHLLYAENQEVSFQRDGGTEHYDVNLPPPDAPRREGTEWGSADPKISDALWSGRFSSGFLSLDLRSAGLADPQTLAWRAVGTVGENTASFVNPVGFDRADVNFFTDHLSSPQSWRRHFFIDIVQEPSSFPLTPAFLLVGTGGFTAEQQTIDYASEISNGTDLTSENGTAFADTVSFISAGTIDTNLNLRLNGIDIPFVFQYNTTNHTWRLWVSPDVTLPNNIVAIVNGISLNFNPANVSTGVTYKLYSFSGSANINSADFTLDITGTGVEFGRAGDTVIERIPLTANDPSGHNTQESLWWSEDPAASSFTVAQLNEKTFDVEFTNGTFLYQKPAPAALFTSTDISTLNNLALVTLDKINRVNTNTGGTFYLQGHKRVHNGADYLRLTLFNDEALTDQANRDDINPTFAHSTMTTVSFNFRLEDFPATNELKKTPLSDLSRQIAKFTTPRDAQLQQEINDLRHVTSKLSVTGRPTTDTEPVLGSLHLTAERPDAGERSGGFTAGQQTIDYSEDVVDYSGTTKAIWAEQGNSALENFNSNLARSETNYRLRINGVNYPFVILYTLGIGNFIIAHDPAQPNLPSDFRLVVNGTTLLPAAQNFPLTLAGVRYYQFIGNQPDDPPAIDEDFTFDITGTGVEFGRDVPLVITGPEFLDYTDTVRSGSNSHKFLIIERPFDEDKNDLELLLTADGTNFPDLIGDGRNFVEIPSTNEANRYYYYQLLDAFQEQGVISIQRRTASFAETIYNGKVRIVPRVTSLPLVEDDYLSGELVRLTNPQSPFTGETEITFAQIASNIVGVQAPFSGSDVYRIAFTETTKGGWVQTDGLDHTEVNLWTHLILGNTAYALSPGVLTVDGNTLKQVVDANGNILTGEDSPFNDIDVGDAVRASVRKRDGSYIGGATPTYEVGNYERQVDGSWRSVGLVHPDYQSILNNLSNFFRSDRNIGDAKLFLNHTRGWSDGLSGLDNVPDDFPSAIHSITWHNDISDTNRYRRFVIEVTEAASARSYHEKTFVYDGTEHELFYYTRSGNNNRYRTAANSQTSDPGSTWDKVNLENIAFEVHDAFTGAKAWLFHRGDGDPGSSSAGVSGGAGPRGPAGPQGDTGPAGPIGPAGPQGDTGPAGPAGTNGTDGATGDTGPRGPQGDTGPAGAAGTNGMDGATGPTGPAGAAGTNGTDGTDAVFTTLTQAAYDALTPVAGQAYFIEE